MNVCLVLLTMLHRIRLLSCGRVFSPVFQLHSRIQLRVVNGMTWFHTVLLVCLYVIFNSTSKSSILYSFSCSLPHHHLTLSNSWRCDIQQKTNTFSTRLYLDISTLNPKCGVFLCTNNHILLVNYRFLLWWKLVARGKFLLVYIRGLDMIVAGRKCPTTQETYLQIEKGTLKLFFLSRRTCILYNIDHDRQLYGT